MAIFMVRSRTGVFHDPDQIKRNLVALNDQRNLAQFCDVVLKVCDTQIYAHSNILAAASPYFGSILDLGVGTDCPRGFSQKQPQVIEIHIDLDLSYGGDGGYGEAVNKVIEFMYTSYITLTPSSVLQVAEICKLMQVEKLLQFCEQFQNGADSNSPQNVSTCTTGLQEVANLLGSRAKTIKRVDVFTETEEIMFEKVRPNTTKKPSQKKQKLSQSRPAESLHHQTACTVPDDPVNSLDTRSTQDLVDAEEIDTSISTAVGFDTLDSIDQNEKDASLLLAISNVRPPLNLIGIGTKTVSNGNGVDDNKLSGGDKGSSPLPMDECTPTSSHIIQHEECQSSSLTTFDSAPSHDTCMNNDKTICEMMNLSVSVIKPNSEDVASQESSTRLNDNVIPPEASQNSCSVQDKLKKDINLDEISDLVKFDPVTTALFHSNLRGRSSGRPRGRGRGRGRGKKRGRGRGPGRPRKSVEEPESDPEFEDFIKRLERGDDVLHSGDEEKNSEPQHKKPHKDDENEVVLTQAGEKLITEERGIEIGDVLVKKEVDTSISDFSLPGSSSRAKWKSTRVRSKPSQLKRDYVMHSLARRTRGQQNISKYDRVSALGQDRRSKPFGVSNPAKKDLKFICEKCDFSTYVFKAYRLHLKVHPETDPKCYMCTKCDFKTIKSREYKAHKRKHMREDLICLYCELQLSTPAEYQEHALKHAGDYPFFCLECDSKFRTRNQLIAHKPKHQLEKPFVCAICGSGFKWKHALKNHMITHSATKDHLCDVCGYATAHKSQLKAHKLIHTGLMFKCPVEGCHFEAIKRQNLKYHMVTHTHEKPHQCDICGQSFSLIKNMRRHMLLHEDARPYACKICSFSTTRYDKLKEHNLKLHSISENLVSKKALVEEPSELVNSANVTYISPGRIAINADGTISEEALQRIAQIAVSQARGSEVTIQEASTGLGQVGEEGAEACPVIATVQYVDLDENNGVRYIVNQ